MYKTNSGCRKQHLVTSYSAAQGPNVFLLFCFVFLPTYIAVIDEAAQHTNDNDTYW